MGARASRVGRMTWVLILLALVLQAAVASDDPVLLIRMPDETALASDPSDAGIARFVAERSPYLQMTVHDLVRDRAFARQVLGQRQIFEELEAFRAQENITARVRFIAWPDAFRFFADYVSDKSNPPIVAQLGDTWASYFRSLGVVASERRHTWDVRVLWYWKDMVAAHEIAEGDGFLSTCRRLHEAPPSGLIAPLAIPTAPDWNLLHDLSIWLYNAGLPTLILTDKKPGLLPWKEAIFAGPEGERAVHFLIQLARRGYVALPEKRSAELAEDFLTRKYAMVILGPWLTKLAEKTLGTEWRHQIGATLPPRIGSPAAVTMKGGSLLVVLDPTRGRDLEAVRRARRLVEFFASSESQRRYAEALGALPARQEVLEASPYFDLFQMALEQGRTYPQIPEWAPVVENLATRDNLYAFWKRLSALTEVQATATEAEQTARTKLILAALHSAEMDINRELSPGRLASLRPWLLAIGALLFAIAALSFWHRHVERKRVEELRQTRDLLATLQRRLASVKEAAPASPEIATWAGKGYPALYLDAAHRKVWVRRSPTHPLEEIIHGAEYDLFRHILECLQAGWHETHWIWSYVIWPTAQPKFPKEAFATHCTKLRKKIETVWQLGPLLGRGARHSGVIPIEVKDAHFYTEALPEGTAYPIWALFHASEKALQAYRAHSWEAALHHARELVTMDPDNWLGNTLVGHLVVQKRLAAEDPLAQRTIAFAHQQKSHYDQALEKTDLLPEDKIESEQKQRLEARREILQLITTHQGMTQPTTPHAKPLTPWRNRDQLLAWLAYLNGEKYSLSSEEIKALREVQRFLHNHLRWAAPQQVDEHFRSFLQDLVGDRTSWPDERLPRSKQAFKNRAADYVLASLYGLQDDKESKAITKAQNLRKLWSIRAQLRKELQQEPTSEQLSHACRRRYGWSRSLVERLLDLERSSYHFYEGHLSGSGR